MERPDYTISFVLDNTPEEVFDAINDIRSWWTENMTGSTGAFGDEFAVRFWDLHYSEHRVTEFVPRRKVVWLTTDSYMTFTENRHEWTDSEIRFEITQTAGETLLVFTHEGLNAGCECYQDCANAWSGYLDSLRTRITTGHGCPEKIQIGNQHLTISNHGN